MKSSSLSSIIQTENLHFSYGKGKVLQGISLDVAAGSIFGFLGPNGAGKSTTIKVLLGLLRVKEGKVKLFDREVKDHRSEILALTGAMVESPSLYEHLDARRNLQITQKLRSLPASRIPEVLDIVGLSYDSHKPVKQFSTGMKQRLSLAIALLGKPKLLILDEPINGLDPTGIIEIRNLLLKLNHEEGCTIFLSSHILDEIEKLCTHVAVINLGKVLYQGEARGFLEKYSIEDEVLLETSDNLKAAGMLGTYGAKTDNEYIRIHCKNRQEIAGIVHQLSNAGIDIYAVSKSRSDMENSFLELLKEGGSK